MSVAAAVSMFMSVPLLGWSENSTEAPRCASDADGCFQLNGVALEGMTAYEPKDLLPLYEDYLLREVATEDLVRVASAITDKYRADGYFLTRAVVPPQIRGGGIARIRIYEGYVSKAEITGVGAMAIKPYFAGLAGKRPLKLADLDHRLTLAADEPGIELKTQLIPSDTDPAEHRLEVVAAVSKTDFSAYVDNRGSRGAGPLQTYAYGAMNSAVFSGDQLAVSVLTTPTDLKELIYGEASYTAPLGEGRRVRAAASASKARQDGRTLANQIGSESWSASLGYSQPLVRSRKAGVWINVAAATRHVEQRWSSGVAGYEDRLRIVRASINGSFNQPGTSTKFGMQLSAGRRSDAVNGMPLSRAEASRSFQKLSAQVAHYRDIGAHAGVYLAGDGQWSNDQLLASEEFALGGAPYGRGYSYGEITGDSGLGGTVELRAGVSPKNRTISFVQAYGFLDAGKVWNRGQMQRSAALASTGLGLRLRVADQATLGFEVARPLTRTPYDQGSKAWRPFASLSARF